MRNRRKVPATGRDRTHFAIDPDIENCGSSRRNCSFKLRSEINGLFHEYARGAHRARHHCVISGEEFASSIVKTRSEFAILAEISHLLIAYRTVAKVVPDQPDHWNVVLNGREHGT